MSEFYRYPNWGSDCIGNGNCPVYRAADQAILISICRLRTGWVRQSGKWNGVCYPSSNCYCLLRFWHKCNMGCSVAF